MGEGTHPAIVFMSWYVIVIVTGSVIYYVKDILMEKINDWRMLREEIEEEKETLRVSIKEIEDA